MLEVINKWNGHTYKVLETTDNTVFLERDDGSRFVIAKKNIFSITKKKLLTK